MVWPYKDVKCYRANQGMMLSWVFNYVYVGGVLLLFMHFFYRAPLPSQTYRPCTLYHVPEYRVCRLKPVYPLHPTSLGASNLHTLSRRPCPCSPSLRRLLAHPDFARIPCDAVDNFAKKKKAAGDKAPAKSKKAQ